MNTFLAAAACMAALAAAAVAVPLVRDRQSRLVGAVAAILVSGAAAGLYPLWSNWDWHAPAMAAGSPDVTAMVGKLTAHLRDDPNDLAGWLMLGRSYLVLEKLDDAILAYDHAHRLDASNGDAVLGLGESLSLRSGGDIPPQAAALFEEAFKLSPGNPKALLYSGFAAAARGDNALARARWLALKALHPPEQIETMLDQRIAELGAAPGPAAAAAVPAIGGADAAERAAVATVALSIAPGLRSRLSGDATLFVFAREPGGKGPPLAAKRLTDAAIGTDIRLSSADSMVPGRVLMTGKAVSITARVSFSGQPLPAPGDLYGELTYDVGRDGVRNLVIDKVAQ